MCLSNVGTKEPGEQEVSKFPIVIYMSFKAVLWTPEYFIAGLWVKAGEYGRKNSEETALKSNILMKSNVILYVPFLKNMEVGFFFLGVLTASY